MPVDDTALWVPAVAGSIAARGAARLARWMDSDYISPWGSNSATASVRMRRSFRRTVKRRPRRRRRVLRRRYRRPTAIPYKIVRTLHSCQYLAQNPGAGTLAVNNVRLNDLNDPTSGFGTESPLAHDQYGALYERYAVIGAKLVVEAVSTEVSNPMKVGVTVTPSSTALTSYEHYSELTPTSSRVLTSDVDKCVLAVKTGFKRWYGSTRILTGDNDYTAAIGASPTKMVYAAVWAGAMDQAADPGNVHFVVHLTQTVVYYRPKTFLARS